MNRTGPTTHPVAIGLDPGRRTTTVVALAEDFRQEAVLPGTGRPGDRLPEQLRVGLQRFAELLPAHLPRSLLTAARQDGRPEDRMRQRESLASLLGCSESAEEEPMLCGAAAGNLPPPDRPARWIVLCDVSPYAVRVAICSAAGAEVRLVEMLDDPEAAAVMASCDQEFVALLARAVPGLREADVRALADRELRRRANRMAVVINQAVSEEAWLDTPVLLPDGPGPGVPAADMIAVLAPAAVAVATAVERLRHRYGSVLDDADVHLLGGLSELKPIRAAVLTALGARARPVAGGISLIANGAARLASGERIAQWSYPAGLRMQVNRIRDGRPAEETVQLATGGLPPPEVVIHDDRELTVRLAPGDRNVALQMFDPGSERWNRLHLEVPRALPAGRYSLGVRLGQGRLGVLVLKPESPGAEFTLRLDDAITGSSHDRE